jgi:hypothetical protein
MLEVLAVSEVLATVVGCASRHFAHSASSERRPAGAAGVEPAVDPTADTCTGASTLPSKPQTTLQSATDTTADPR